VSAGDHTKIATLRTVEAFREVLESVGAALPCDSEILAAPDSPLARPAQVLGRRVGNRFAIQPMEGWDGTEDGLPGPNTLRRWRRFGESGAKLIWGCEAVAVRHDGRANPRQLVLTPETCSHIARLREELVRAHRQAMGDDSDLLVGLQLTHSGRYSRPNRWDLPEPKIVYHHPLLDRRLGIGPDHPVLSDGEVRELVEQFARAARLAVRAGFDFVDVKHCHGYLGHEFLSAVARSGDYGGSLENRMRFLREVVEAVRAEAPGLGIGVRLSAFDLVPFRPDPDRSAPGRPGPGIPEEFCDCMPYVYAFGVDPDQPTEMDLAEPMQFLEALRGLDVRFVNLTAGSPYYNPHIQRPALYPPSDGYQPPEDPLIGVARQMHAARILKAQFPDFVFVGSALSYLQDFLPHVAQAAVREGWTDFAGLGRMVLSYPELPRDVLAGGPLQTKRVCRTFSDCTTAPRNALPSGCYPLDPHYKRSPEARELAVLKKRLEQST